MAEMNLNFFAKKHKSELKFYIIDQKIAINHLIFRRTNDDCCKVISILSNDLLWNEEKNQWISADEEHKVYYFDGIEDSQNLKVKGWLYWSTNFNYVLQVS